MADLIQTMEGALAQFSAGEAEQPLRTVMELGGSTSFFGVMPARLRDPAALGTKLVGVFPGNTADGVHVVSVGACRPDHCEMAPALVARGTLFVDSRAAALVESGDIVQGIAAGLFGPDQIRAELGDVVAGRAAGRSTPGEVTIFKSLGLAVEDVAEC